LKKPKNIINGVWEVYSPLRQDETYRCGLNDVNELLENINYALGNKRKYLNKILTEKS